MIASPDMFRSSELRVLEVFSNVAGRLPWGAGHYRVAARYAGHNRWVTGSYANQRMRSGALVRLDLGDRPQVIAYLVRDYSPALTSYIVSRLPPGGIFFDVGANVGLISFSVAQLRPDAIVHAFEPNPINAAAWQHNRQLNDVPRTTLMEVAVSDRVGTADFTVPSDCSSGTIRSGGDHTVPTTTLDTYCKEQGIDHIDVLKIDVEGHEPSVLRGALGLLEAGAVNTILCEVLNMGGHARESINRMLYRHCYKACHVPPVGVRRLIYGSRGSADDIAFER